MSRTARDDSCSRAANAAATLGHARASRCGRASSGRCWTSCPRTAATLSVLFAGGIHDGLSAAMVAALAAPLTARGVRVGVLMGTAYLFTEEAVSHGAITEAFQRAALTGTSTVLLESGPGHATRCLPSPFVDDFAAERLRLLTEDARPGRASGSARAAEHRPAAHRRQGHRPQPRACERSACPEARRARRRAAVAPGPVHDRAGRRDARSGRHDGRPARDAGGREPPPGWPLCRPRSRRQSRLPSRPTSRSSASARSCPGAADARTFWDNIVNGVDAITEIPETRWDWRRYFDADRAAPRPVYSQAGAGSSATSRSIRCASASRRTRCARSSRSSCSACSWPEAALDDAGYAERPFARERTSVMFGAGGGGADLAVGYTVRSALPTLLGDDGQRLIDDLGERLPEWTEDSFPGMLMNVAAGRIANRLDLGGVELHRRRRLRLIAGRGHARVRELQSGTSDMAIVGGADAIQNPLRLHVLRKTQALSPTGRCRPVRRGRRRHRASARGSRRSSSSVCADAERDGDRIYGVIKGVGAASDGRDRGLTAPRPEGQMRALRPRLRAGRRLAGRGRARRGARHGHGGRRPTEIAALQPSMPRRGRAAGVARSARSSR